jgi:hypothetical protein
VAEKIFESKLDGRRKVGRSRLRWQEDVENDLQELKVKRWQRANNIEKWAFVVNEINNL